MAAGPSPRRLGRARMASLPAIPLAILPACLPAINQAGMCRAAGRGVGSRQHRVLAARPCQTPRSSLCHVPHLPGWTPGTPRVHQVTPVLTTVHKHPPWHTGSPAPAPSGTAGARMDHARVLLHSVPSAWPILKTPGIGVARRSGGQARCWGHW